MSEVDAAQRYLTPSQHQMRCIVRNIAVQHGLGTLRKNAADTIMKTLLYQFCTSSEPVCSTEIHQLARD